jgi:hypothetical protein
MRHYRNATSLGLAITATLAMLSLGACGGQSDAQFNASFDKSTHDSCVSSAGSHGLPAAQAETYCTCVVKELDKLSVADKMQLPMHQDKMTAVAQTCVAQMGGGVSAAPATNAP